MTSSGLATFPATDGHRASRGLRRLTDSYIGSAIVHPLNAVTVALLAVSSALLTTPLPFLFGLPLAQAIIVAALPRWGRFRRSVDRSREVRWRRAREDERDKAVSLMNPTHKETAVMLRGVGALLARTPDGRLLEDRFGFEALIDEYIRLAQLHDEMTERLRGPAAPPARQDGDELQLGGDRREIVAGSDRPIDRRLRDVERQRCNCRESNAAKLSLLATQLDVIASLVLLLHERTLFAADLHEVDARIDAFADELDRSSSIVEAIGGHCIDSDERGSSWPAG